MVGESHTNIARGTFAFMSSLARSNRMATKGNDGTYSSYFRTAHEDQAWWAVDLGQGHDTISRVRITNIEGYHKGKCLNVVLRDEGTHGHSCTHIHM